MVKVYTGTYSGNQTIQSGEVATREAGVVARRHTVVRHILEDDPLSGYVFIFFNKPRDKIKLLVWDKDGYVLYQKRLERGRFEEIPARSEIKNKITYDHLVMLISGISMRHLVQRKRYSVMSTV